MRIFTRKLLLLIAMSCILNIAQGQDMLSLVKGLKKYDGYFPFYYDAKSGKILLEVNKLDQEFLYFASLPAGVGSGGPELGKAKSDIVKFTLLGGKLLLIQPNYRFRAVTGNKDQIRSVENAFAKSVIWGFKPLATEGDKVLIDLTPFLISDSQQIGGTLGKAPYKLDESRSAIAIENTKNFPQNTEFESLITFTGGSPSGGYGGGGIAPDPTAVTVSMRQSFVALPEPGFKQRKFDPRSGLNPFNYYDFSADMDQPLIAKFSRRQRLVKKKPGLAPSEPVKPIVYYVDRGAPEKIKKALIEGGNWWNEAFTAAGFINGFVVKELPEGIDPMDIRYNVINWVNRNGNPRGYSFGNSYIDPRTGEIIKGVVTLGSDRHRQDYLIAEGLLQPYQDGKPVPKELEELTLARIRQLSAHEIGHTIGLYHNFAASVKDRASVMDYPAPYFTMDKTGKIDVQNAYAKGIGEWDKRAIMWGYSEFDAGTDENKALDQIMKETLAQGFIQIPDVGGDVHPLSHQWDNGNGDVTAELNRLLQIRKQLITNFSEKAIAANAPMSTLEEVLVPIYLLHRYQIEAVSKLIGGLYFTHALKNDGQVPTALIPPAQQQAALNALLLTIKPENLRIPEQLLEKIPPRPSGFPGGREVFSRKTGPTFDPLSAAESVASFTVAYLLDGKRAARLTEYAARDTKQPGFIHVAGQLINQTWKAPDAGGMDGQLQIVVNNLVLKYLLALGSGKDISENVQGQALLKIEELNHWLEANKYLGTDQQNANRIFALSQIKTFHLNPAKFEIAPAAEMPPGAPIGMDNPNLLQ
ncbi:zinc-dependent metalloprotease [Pedobacter antarcticus]|uniref:zinc-dependent metalloprotease n=1 Tax=Pedobacter antarcticus TaxID=34086 RepID=UPI00292FE4DF|nr:zinc-dependent metalloprotease [Pedobacter antarcticus]